ncbi:5-hydroxyisourate hydrolase [Striga asiatica]|uniref:5-hydroxyisourate hydrolase n=1 Tax=Striga asiatica TaxID=4170 RepID=A0A5A7RJH7_STRAF|nr:5-hydroxyisourate hydrolase [Striga asiatica]
MCKEPRELYEWNARYRSKFGFVFLIFASGRSTPEILAELKRRYQNRPIVEFQIAAQEQMKITELRVSKLFSAEITDGLTSKNPYTSTNVVTKAGEDRVSIIGGHLAGPKSEARTSTRTRPPITTHILDVARGAPALGIDVRLEMWGDKLTRPFLGQKETDYSGSWKPVGRSTTDKDGRAGELMDIVDDLSPGVYRISFDTGKYNPNGFFPYVSIVFEVREGQSREHFHVPLLLSPFSFSTYRGS